MKISALFITASMTSWLILSNMLPQAAIDKNANNSSFNSPRGSNKLYDSELKHLSNALQRVQFVETKRDKNTLNQVIETTHQLLRKAISVLNSGSIVTTSFNNRTTSAACDSEGHRYTYEYWNELYDLRTITCRDAKNKKLFYAVFHTNGLLKSFTDSKMESYIEFYPAGDLKMISVTSWEARQNFAIEWSEEGKMKSEFDGSLPAAIRGPKNVK